MKERIRREEYFFPRVTFFGAVNVTDVLGNSPRIILYKNVRGLIQLVGNVFFLELIQVASSPPKMANALHRVYNWWLVK